jgi:hypothetical protein
MSSADGTPLGASSDFHHAPTLCKSGDRGCPRTDRMHRLATSMHFRTERVLESTQTKFSPSIPLSTPTLPFRPGDFTPHPKTVFGCEKNPGSCHSTP